MSLYWVEFEAFKVSYQKLRRFTQSSSEMNIASLSERLTLDMSMQLFFGTKSG
jgi:hypothetical protein